MIHKNKSNPFLIVTFSLLSMATSVLSQNLSPPIVNLGTSGNYVILAKSGISTTGTTAITGDLGLSPAAASFITGFGIAAPPTTYAISTLVTGKIYASDYNTPTPSNLTTAVSDMMTAYTNAAGRAANTNELGAGNIGGKTIAPAVYKWTTNVLVPSDVTLSGSATDVWIFEIAGNLTLNSGVKVVLQGGALPRNIFWQVAGAVDLETTAHLEGVALSQTAIVLKTGATANGRLLALTAVTLDAVKLVQPASATPIFLSPQSSIGSNSFAARMLRSTVSFRAPGENGDRISRVDVWGRTVMSTAINNQVAK